MIDFDFKEFRILRCPHRGKYDNLTITIELQKEDAPLALELYYRKCWQDGVSLNAEVTELEKREKSIIEKFNEQNTGEKIMMVPNNKYGHTFPITHPKQISPQSIYQKFKWFCDSVGKNYQQEKQNIIKAYMPDAGKLYEIKHMKDLEQYYDPKTIEEYLINRIEEIKQELNFFTE